MLTKLFRARAPAPPAEPPTSARADDLAPEIFRAIFARQASSVTVVTFLIGRHLHGFTATSLIPVSMSPPIALFCVGRKNDSHRHLQAGTKVGISILSAEQTGISARFAGKAELGGYADIPMADTIEGVPLVKGAVAGISGTVSELIPAGDHTIYLCKLGSGVLGSDGDPLLYFSKDYWCLGATLLAPPDKCPGGDRS